MGVSSSPEQLVAKFTRAAVAVGSNRPALERAAFAAKLVFAAEAAAAGVGPGVGRSKVARTIRANYRVFGGAAEVRFTGPAHLVNNPTKAHQIAPKRRRGGKALNLPNRGTDQGIRRSVSHPGTQGKHFFERAVPLVQRKVPVIYRREGLVGPLREVFR